MIPRTFPSIIEAFQTKMVVYVLPSVSGLTAWIDYIPVKGVVTEDPVLANTYANAGYQVVKSQESLTGQAWLDYIPVYEDASYNKPWSTDAGGYIPVGGLFSPASLFAAGEQGWWYDPSNMSTLFQDSAGTTPVTAMEQPVGLQLDLSKGLVLGTELVPSTIPSISGAGWTTNGTSITATSSTASGTIALTASTPSTKFYQVTFTASGLSGATSYMVFSSGVSALTKRINTAKTYSFIVPGQGTAAFEIAPYEGTAFSVTISNITVRELPGNHRFQTTSANRPVVSARVNLLTKTEQFDDAYWLKTRASVTANVTATTDPLGGNTADKCVEDSSASSTHVISASAGFPSGILTTVSLYVKAAERSQIFIGRSQNLSSGAVFDVSTGTVVSSAGASSTSITNVGDGWYRCVATWNSGFSYNLFFGIADAGAISYTGDGTSGIYIWGADLRPANQGVNLPDYQRVNTSTDYDSTGFPVYIKPNGSNQFMQTNSINFTATDKMTVWQGVRKLSDATGFIFETSSDLAVNTGAFALWASSDPGYRFGSRGSATTAIAIASVFSSPITNTLTGLGDISGDLVTLRVNGTVAATSSADQGTGNYGTYPAYFYARAGTSLYFNGHDYGSIARGAASTAAQIANGEKYMATKTAVTLLVETFDFITTDAGDQIVTDAGDSVISDTYFA
jgi:hypothetical protein